MKIAALALLIASFCLMSTLSAQRNFQPGSIFSKSGDTLTGEIDYQKWERNPRKILFRQLNSVSTTQYDASSISGFAVADEVYKSAIVELDWRYDDVKRLSTVRTVESAIDTLFLRVLVDGSKPLYHYYDNVDHFYIAKNDSVELLKFKKYRVAGSGATRQVAIQVNQQYRAQLNEYLQGCSSIGDSLARTSYEARSLRKAILSYYHCNSTTPVHVQTVENSKLEMGVLAGVSRSTLKIRGTHPPTASNLSYPASTDFTAGAFFDLVFPRNRGRVSFYNELLYTSYNTKAAHTLQTATTLDIYTYDFAYSYIRMNNMIRYRFVQSATSFYINGGIANGMAIKEKNTVTQYHKVGPNERITVEPGLKDSRKHEFGFVAGIGAKRGRAGFELRADRGNGFAPYSISRSSVVRYFALVSYRLK